MSRVNVDAQALTDTRFVKLARRLELPGGEDQARGLMLRVWMECVNRETTTLDPEDLAIALRIDDPEEAVNALVGASLAEAREPSWGGRVRIRGCIGRTDWLKKKRHAGRKGAEKRWEKQGVNSTANGTAIENENGYPIANGMHSCSGSGSCSCSGSGSKRDTSYPLSGRPDDVAAVIELLNQRAGRQFSPTAKATVRLVRARLREHTLDELLAVVEHRCAKWKHDSAMRDYLRPETLFNATKFESYVGQVGQPASALAPDDDDHLNPEGS